MGFSLSRLALGVAVMAVACGLSYAVGGRTVRRAVVAVVVCWLAASAAQLALRAQWPSIAGNVACGLVLLRLAVQENRIWPWILVAIEAVLLVLHALLFGSAGPIPPPAETIGNNLLVSAGLLVLVLAALGDWLRRKAPIPNM